MTSPPGKSFRVSLALLVIVMAGVATRASTLADYRHRVSEAIHIIEQLQRAKDEASTYALVLRLRSELPAKETVLLQGQNISVDNAWLHDALDEFEKEKVNSARRNESLARLRERLLALSESLDKIENRSSPSTKDEDKGRLAEILRRPEYNKTVSEGSALERLWIRFLRWLLSLMRGKSVEPGNARFLSSIAQVTVVIVGLALVGFLIWKLAPRFLRNRKQKKRKREARIVLGERLEPDQTSADLLAQAEDLARGGDLRAAIRKAYIAFLCELGDRKVINLAQHKTNRDYLGSVRERPSLYASMRKLTNSFEIHWYGLVPAGEFDWQEFRNDYLRALKIH